MVFYRQENCRGGYSIGWKLAALGKANRLDNYLYKPAKEGRLEPYICLRFGRERLVSGATHAINLGVSIQPSIAIQLSDTGNSGPSLTS